jgi:hypothetical protein
MRTAIRRHFPAASKAEVSVILRHFLAENSLKINRVGMPDQPLILINSSTDLGGGIRYWIVCPGCSRRAAKLYEPWEMAEYKCRSCHNLIYRAQKEHDKRVDRLLKDPLLLHELSLNRNLKDSQELVIIKALMKRELAKIGALSIKKGVYNGARERPFSIDLGSFGKK